MEKSDSYQDLAAHLGFLGMGFPPNEKLEPLLKEVLSSREAEMLLAVPSGVKPLTLCALSEIAEKLPYPGPEVEETLDALAKRGFLFRGRTDSGEKAFSLQQVSFGFPQGFFWKGEATEFAKGIVKFVTAYMDDETTKKVYGTDPKAYRFIPVNESIHPDLQTVYPFHVMDTIIDNARRIAIVNCICRFRKTLLEDGCEHTLEACIKYDELADYVIEQEMGREVSKEEAKELMAKFRDEGLVHFVDNAIKDVKHNCNCCGCACWSVGRIRRRRFPRDLHMATYFIRKTDDDLCMVCGDCMERCPVDCLTVEDDRMVTDLEWCIGCGVCAYHCPTEAIEMVIRPDKMDQIPETNFGRLHDKILASRQAR